MLLANEAIFAQFLPFSGIILSSLHPSTPVSSLAHSLGTKGCRKTFYHYKLQQVRKAQGQRAGSTSIPGETGIKCLA